MSGREWLRKIGAGLGMMLGVAGCTGTPSGVEPVRGFDVDRYLGTWYEIARLDHSFERGLNNVTAVYSPRPDGKIAVVNRGYDAASGRWKEAKGVAVPVGKKDVGSLKVSFFWPFWAGYHVVALDKDEYGYAIVTGYSRAWLWILARRPELEPEVLSELVGKAKGWGYETEKLIFVEHGEGRRAGGKGMP